jgi:hypothetical protein
MCLTISKAQKITSLKSGGRTGGDAGVGGLDVLQGSDSLAVCLDIWERGKIDADVGGPAQHDVQITIGHGEGVTHHKLLVTDDSALQVSEFLGGIASDEGLDILGQSWVEKTADGRMNFSRDVTQHVLKNSTLSGTVQRSNFTRSLYFYFLFNK